MTKLVKWGHGVLAFIISVDLCIYLRDGLLRVIRAAHQGHPAAYLIGIGFWELFFAGIAAAFIWGILTWNDWAYGLLVLWIGFWLLASVATLVFGHGQLPIHFLNFRGAFALVVFIWLLLPAVRHRYWRSEEQTA